MTTHAELRCPPPGAKTRRVYLLTWGGQGGVQVHEWKCPACLATFRDRDKSDCQKLADAHVCDAGWCPVPYGGRARLRP